MEKIQKKNQHRAKKKEMQKEREKKPNQYKPWKK